MLLFHGRLCDLIVSHENWLVERILFYAKERNYVKYTSTLKEAWRISIEQLSQSLLEALQTFDKVLEHGPDDDYTQDQAASYGVLQAKRHRARGVSLGMFMGLMKYYRQSYTDMVRNAVFDRSYENYCLLFIDRFFERIELAFCEEWAESSNNNMVNELQIASRALENEKNKYLTIFESLSNPVIFLNSDHKIENLNQAAGELLFQEYSSGATYYNINKNIERKLPWLTEIQEFISNGGNPEIKFEKDVETLEGTLFFEIKITKMLDISEKYNGSVLILNDVTKRKTAVEAMRTSEKKYRSIFETTGTAMVIIEENTTISLANGEFEKLSGFSKNEVESKKSWTDFVLKADLGKMMEYHNLRRNNPAAVPNRYEHRLVDKHGNIRHIMTNVTIIPGTKKSVASLMDTTDLKRAEEALIRYQILSRHARDVILFVHSNGRIIEGNDAALKAYGYTRDELTSLSIFDLRAPETASMIEEQMEQASQKGILFETIHRRKDGSLFPVEVSSQGTAIGKDRVLLSVIRDITQRKQADELLIASESNYRIIFNASNDAIFIHDIESGNILDANQKMCEMFGYTPEEVKQLKIDEISVAEPPYDKRHAKQFINKAVEGNPQIFEWLAKNKTGKLFWVEVNLKRVLINGCERLLAVIRDINERKRAEKELQRLSFLDGLTGIANRRYFDEYIERELKQAIRLATALSLIMCDIDYFKAYNDTYGHLGGDSCLIKVAGALQGVLKRPADIVARYGGEEFAIVLPTTDAAGASVVAEKLRAGVEALGIDHAGSLISTCLTISLGVATIYPKPNFPSQSLINAADQALYHAKQEGRNRVNSAGTINAAVGA
jgi:diguanylate cyclase (GGDEF)-like protein/PAS domain S-box-containing protein